MLAYIRNPLAIGRKLGIAARIGSRGNLYAGSGFKRVVPKLAFGVEEQVLGIGGPMVPSDGVTAAPLAVTIVFVLLADGSLWRRK